MVLLACSPTASALAWQEQMLDSINSIRADKSLTPLKMCKPLVSAAQNYAKKMALQDFLAHEGKDGSSACKMATTNAPPTAETPMMLIQRSFR